MSDDFDPYYKWLGIGPDERPASHYRLLAIREFEPDPEVIESAADRQMSHVRSFQTGAHSADSQRLLNELSAARVCLLNPAKKAFYDGQLQRLLAASKAAEVAKAPPVAVVPAPPPPAIVDTTEVLTDIISSSPGRRTHPVVEKTQSWQRPVIAAIVATMIVLGAGVTYRLIVSRQVAVAPRDPVRQASSGEASQNRDQATGEAAGSEVAEPEGIKQEEARRRELARKAEQDRQREAVAAAQKKAAEEQNQQKEREAEEERRAAAEDAKRMAMGTTVGLPNSDVHTAAQARSGSRTPIKPKVVPPLVIDLQEPLASCSVEMDEVPKGMMLLEVTRLEGSGYLDARFTVDKPKPLPLGSRGSIGLTIKGYRDKAEFPLAFATKSEGTGFDISLKVAPKIVAACKNPPKDIEAAKKELRKMRDDARDGMEKAKTNKVKVAMGHVFEKSDRALASLEFFSGVNMAKVHFHIYLDAGDEQQTVLVTTEAP